MNGLLAFLGVAIALVLALLLLVRLRPASLPSEGLIELPDRVLMARILAEDDAAFVESLGSPLIRQYYIRERRRLALAWLRRLFCAARKLRQRHVLSARHSSDVHLGAELRLACEFVMFILAYAAVVGLVASIGPMRGRRLLGGCDSLITSLAQLASKIAARVSTPQPGVTE